MTRVVMVQVTVNDDGVPSCDPEVVPVVGDPTLIQFNLTPAAVSGKKYRFPDAFAVQVQDPRTNFPYSCWKISDTCVTLFDANVVNGAFPYYLTVEVEIEGAGDGGASTKAMLITFDPMINNGA